MRDARTSNGGCDAHQNLNVTPARVSLFTLSAFMTPCGGARRARVCKRACVNLDSHVQNARRPAAANTHTHTHTHTRAHAHTHGHLRDVHPPARLKAVVRDDLGFLLEQVAQLVVLDALLADGAGEGEALVEGEPVGLGCCWWWWW